MMRASKAVCQMQAFKAMSSESETHESMCTPALSAKCIRFCFDHVHITRSVLVVLVDYILHPSRHVQLITFPSTIPSFSLNLKAPTGRQSSPGSRS